MPQYFSKFPKIKYKFKFVDSKGNVQSVDNTLTNITVRYALTRKNKERAEIFYPYSWNDNDRPDSFSEKYYDSNDLFWLVLYGAEKYDVFNEFPKTESIFLKYLYRKYKDAAIEAGFQDTLQDVVRYTKQTIDSYRDSDGDVVDQLSFQNDSGENKRIIYLFDIEEEQNENLRTIDVISLDFADLVRRDFEDVFNKLKKEIEGS